VLEAWNKKITVLPVSVAIMKRGICTFVEKAKNLVGGSADLGLVVNTEDEIVDMPAGKEKTSECSVPIGMMKSSQGFFFFKFKLLVY
jgi:hypothetical protein